MPTKKLLSDTDTDSSSDVEVISRRIDEDTGANPDEQGEEEDEFTESDQEEEESDEEYVFAIIIFFIPLLEVNQSN